MLKTITRTNWKKAVAENQRELDALYRHRAEDIRDKYAKSWSMAYIGNYWGITRQRVQKILESETK